MKNFFLLLLCLFSNSFISAQVTGVQYILDYNQETTLYDAKIVITSGNASSNFARVQGNSQFSIVVTRDTELTIVEYHNPIMGDPFNGDEEPQLWNITGVTEDPNIPLDYHQVVVNTSPTARYEDLNAGDTVKLFSLSTMPVNVCDFQIRIWDNELDPEPADLPSAPQPDNGFTVGSLNQLYNSNGTSNFIGPSISCINNPIQITSQATSCDGLSKDGTSAFMDITCGRTGSPCGGSLDYTNWHQIVIDNEYATKFFIEAWGVDYDVSYALYKNIGNCTPRILLASNCDLQGDMIETDIEKSSITGDFYHYWLAISCKSDLIGVNLLYDVDYALQIDPMAEIVGVDSLCLNGTAQLMPSEGGIWLSTDEGIATVTNEGLVTATGIGTVEFQYASLDDPSCSVLVTEPLTIVTEIPVEILGPTDLCVGATSQLSPGQGGTWTSSNPAVLTVDSSTGLVTANDLGTASFTFTNLNGECENTTDNIEVNGTVMVGSDANEICVGEATSLFSSSPTNNWVSLNPSIADLISGNEIVGISPGMATFRFTDVTGCQAEVVIEVTNTIEVVLDGPDTVCVQGTTSVSPSTGVIWSISDPNILTVNNSGFVIGIAPGTAVVTATEVATGCQSLPSETITVVVDPVVQFENEITEVCLGESAQIFPSFGGSWTSTDESVATVTDGGVITTVGDGTTTFIFTSTTSGCSSVESDMFTVLPAPIISISDNEVCVGELVQLEPTSGGMWTSSNPVIATVTNTGVVTAVGGGICELNFIQTGTLCSPQSVSLTVHDEPDLSIIESDNICVGQTSLIISVGQGMWSSADNLVATVDNQGLITGISSGVTTFTFTSLTTGCVSDESSPLTVNDSPDVTVDQNEICPFEIAQLTPSTGGTWQCLDTDICTVTDSGTVTAISPGICSCVFTSTISQCESDPISITVSPADELEIADTEICVGDSTTINLDNLPVGGFFTSNDNGVAVVNNGKVYGIDVGTAVIRYDFGGCPAEVQVTIINADAGVNQTIKCWETGTTYLQAQGTGTWSAGTGPALVTLDNPSNDITRATGFTAPGTYTFFWSESAVDGCTDAVTIEVGEDCDCGISGNVIVPPTNRIYCYDEVIQLTSEEALPAGGEYFWERSYNNTSFNFPLDLGDTKDIDYSGAMFNLIPGKNYVRRIYIHPDGSCSDTSNVILIISEEFPFMSGIFGEDEFCSGEQLQLFAETGCEGFWTLPSGEIVYGAELFIDDASTADQGNYKFQNVCGECFGEEAVKTINIIQTPITPEITKDMLCVGDVGILYQPDGSLATYSIISGGSVNITPSGLVTAVQLGTSAIVANDFDLQCSSEPIFVTVSEEIEVGVDASQLTICNGESVQLNAFGADTYLWNTGDTSPEIIVSPIETTLYVVQGETMGGCIGNYELIIEVEECNDPCSDPNPSEKMLSGVAFIDLNNNFSIDAGETLLSNVLVTLLGDNEQSILTDDDGSYSFTTTIEDESYSLSANINVGSWENDQLLISAFNDGSACNDNLNFGFRPVEASSAYISVVNTRPTRCDETIKFYLNYENTGSEPITGYVSVTFDELTEYDGFLNSNGTLVDNKVSWFVEDLEPHQRQRYQFFLIMPPASMPFPVMDFLAEFTDEDGVVLASDLLSSELRCSFDPNDKTVKPDREGTENYLLPDEELEYTVRFQNNGNDTAFLVTIVDVLDEYINPRTLRVIDASHEVKTTFDGQEVTFTFEDILLVDSMTNYDESYGHVTFRCKALPGLEEFVTIENKADIIFDTNPPIITNEVLNTFVEDLCFVVAESQEANTICEGDEYLGYTMAGMYEIELTTVAGCDSVHTLILTVESPEIIDANELICEGSSVEINGVEYSESGIFSDTTYSALGCAVDIYSIHIEVTDAYYQSETVTICEGDTYQEYSEAGTYADSLTSVTGCDSLVVLQLLVESPQLSDQQISICPGSSVIFNGKTYDAEGQYQDTVLSALGCASLIYDITIDIYESIEVTTDTTICEGQVYQNYTTSGTYVNIIEGETGCDSILTLNLTVLPMDDEDCISSTFDENFSVNVYPNPSRGEFTIESSKKIDEVKLMSVASGSTSNIKLVYNGNTIKVITQDLPSGIYIIMITTDGLISYEKILIE